MPNVLCVSRSNNGTYFHEKKSTRRHWLKTCITGWSSSLCFVKEADQEYTPNLLSYYTGIINTTIFLQSTFLSRSPVTLFFSNPYFSWRFLNVLSSLLAHDPPEVVDKKGYFGSGATPICVVLKFTVQFTRSAVNHSIHLQAHQGCISSPVW